MGLVIRRRREEGRGRNQGEGDKTVARVSLFRSLLSPVLCFPPSSPLPLSLPPSLPTLPYEITVHDAGRALSSRLNLLAL